MGLALESVTSGEAEIQKPGGSPPGIRMAVELMETSANTQQREEVCKHIEELDELIGDLLLASRLDLQTNPPSSVFDVSCIIQEEAERVDRRAGVEGVDDGLEAKGGRERVPVRGLAVCLAFF